MFVASVLLALLMGATFVTLLAAISDLRASTELRRDTRKALVAADDVEKLALDLETGLRGFLITRDQRFLEPWTEARGLFPGHAAALMRLARNLAVDDPGQLARARRILQNGITYITDYSAPLIAAVRESSPSVASVAVADEGRRRIDALRADFDTFAVVARARLARRETTADVAGQRAIMAAAAGIVASIVLVALFAGYLTHVFVRPIRRAASVAHRLGRGDMGARMPATSIGELGELEQSFNGMAESLEASLAESQRLVEQQSALRRVATLVAQADEPVDIFEAVTREVGLLSGADLARMERYETDGTVTGVAGWARESGGRLVVGIRIALEGPSIAALVRDTGGPASVASFADADGLIAVEARALGIRSSVGCPIVVGGRLWGVIAASSRSREPFRAGTELEIADFTELVATAIANAEAGAELAASRARVVAAADHARQRLERDLHDGIQQRLVALSLELRGAEEAAPPALNADLTRIGQGLANAVDELRELARGIHPAILTEGGLVPALKTLARRSPVPVSLDVQIRGRLPERVEVAAYYLASEALANAAKHAAANGIEISVAAVNGRLDLSVADDGVGGADPSRGSGLIGLADRVAAIGGSMTVTSPVGNGTRLRASLPV